MARRARRLGHQVGRHVLGQETVARGDSAAPIDAVGLARQQDGEGLRLFLAPHQGALGAGDYDAEVVLVADANLRGADEGPAAVAELAVDGEVVVELAAFDERLKLGAELRDFEAGDVAELHEGVRADVAAAAGAAGALGVHAPDRLRLAGGLDLGRQPALDVVAVHPAHFAQQPAADDVTAEAAGPVPEVGVGHAERDLQLARGLHQVVGLLEIQAERLFAEHGDAGLHGLHGRVVMHEVGRHDEDVVQLLVRGQGGVGGDHLVVGAVALDGVRPIGCLFEGDLGIGEQRARHHAAGAVKVNGSLVRMDDEGAFAAAD